MSYVRFGWYGSDVYVYESRHDGFLVCGGCAMLHGDPQVATAYGMLLHLREHKRQGDCVPLHVMAFLAEDAEVWTRERVAWWLRCKVAKALRATACRWFGHDEIPFLTSASEAYCRRCMRHVKVLSKSSGTMEVW